MEECCTNQGFQSFVVKDKYNKEFIYYWICNNKNEFISKANGSTFLEISKNQITQIPLPLPTLSEQNKIAEFFSDIDTKIEKLTRKKELTEQYKKGAMQKIFSQEIRFKDENGKDYPDWEEKSLGDIIKLQGGYPFKSESYRTTGIPVIRISNISNNHNYIESDNIVYYEPIENDNTFSLKNGDLIIAMSGATTGKTSIFNLKEKGYLNQRVGLFKAISNDLYYPYLIQFIFSKKFSDQLTKRLVAGAQPNISPSDIESVEIQLPIFAEQKKIADFMIDLDTRIEHIDKELITLKEFKKGLLQGMFV